MTLIGAKTSRLVDASHGVSDQTLGAANLRLPLPLNR